MTTQRIIPRQEVLNILGLSSSTLDRRIHAGLFVPPISLLERRKGWPENEVTEIVNTMVSGAYEESVRKLVTDLIGQRQSLRSKVLEKENA